MKRLFFVLKRKELLFPPSRLCSLETFFMFSLVKKEFFRDEEGIWFLVRMSSNISGMYSISPMLGV